jgi:hypothetical protein
MLVKKLECLKVMDPYISKAEQYQILRDLMFCIQDGKD